MFGMKEYERFTDEYEFIDRSTGAENLLMIVAGFQPYYWDEVFRRVLYYSSRWQEDLDVCICVPSADGAVLSIYSEKYSWSLLHVKENHLALAQNMAIRLHPHAKWIYKLDEDILITDGYFGKLKRAYQRTTDLFPVRAGFTAPLLNINGFGSYYYLKAAGCLDEYEKKFGKYNVSGVQGPIHRSAAAGLFIWNHSLPFDRKMEDVAGQYSDEVRLCPIRFSIGALLFKRGLWTGMGGFLVKDGLGFEEEQICAYCVNHMLGMSIAMDSVCGHLGFGTQKAIVHEFFGNHFDEIQLKEKTNG